MASKKLPVRKKKRILTLLVLIIISGVFFYLIFNIYNLVFNIYNLSYFKAKRVFRVNRAQGSGILSSIFIFSHSWEDTYNGQLYFYTSWSEGVEKFGLTGVNISIYRDEIYQLTIQEHLNGSSIFCYHDFIIGDIYEDHVISCRGEIITEFNVESFIQNETINFELSVKVPKDLIQKRYDRAIALRWTQFGLIMGEITVIGFIINIWAKIKRESDYSEEERKKDGAFWDFIKKKSEEQKE